MGKGRRTVVGIAALIVFLAPGGGYAGQKQGGEQEQLAHFYSAVERYVALHREIERSVPALEISSDAHRIHHAIEGMRNAMQAARPLARPGDIVDPEAANLLRLRIRETLAARGHTTAAILHSQRDEDAEPAQGPPAVNAEFPWARGSSLPACLFAVLPTLPPELQFRLLERDLVLVDTHAGLVVDVVADALPPEDAP
jgi:hypothetical protein